MCPHAAVVLVFFLAQDRWTCGRHLFHLLVCFQDEGLVSSSADHHRPNPLRPRRPRHPLLLPPPPPGEDLLRGSRRGRGVQQLPRG